MKLRLRVAHKIFGLVVIQMFGVVAVLGLALSHSKSALLEERKISMQNLVEASHGVLAYYDGLATKGTLTPEAARQQAIAAVRTLRFGQQDYFWINDMQPRMVMHPTKPEMDGQDLTDYKDPDGRRLFVAFVDTVKRDGAGFVFYLWPKPGSDRPVRKISYVKGFPAWGWIIGSGVYLDDVDAEFRAQAFRFSAAALLIAGLLAGLALALTRSMTRRIQYTVETLDTIAEGDFTVRVADNGADEIGRMGTAINHVVGRVEEALARIVGAAGEVTTASRDVAGAADSLASGSQQQASSLEEAAASLEQITATVKQNAENARQANQFAVGSRETADRGGQVVRRAVDAMGGISQSSKKIADIITVIDDIAFQTNLLALNAAVEAARAGEQGRGFAVVAAEVRNLAQRSAGAAKEIKALIEASVQQVEHGSGLVTQSGQTLDEIVGSVKRVTDLIAEIAAASEEQSTGIDQVNRAVAQMDQVVNGNAAQTQALSSTAQALEQQARQLEAMVAHFKVAAAAAPRVQTVAAPPPPSPSRRPHPRPAPVLAGVGAGRGVPQAKDDFTEF